MLQVINKNAVIEILGLDENHDYDRSYDLDKLNWDSMAMIMLQSHIDTEFNIQIDPDNLPEFKTIGCVDDFIETFK
jgi:acyl carrier protein